MYFIIRYSRVRGNYPVPKYKDNFDRVLVYNRSSLYFGTVLPSRFSPKRAIQKTYTAFSPKRATKTL